MLPRKHAESTCADCDGLTVSGVRGVHRIVSLLKRWLMGTHQGAVSHKHLGYYLDEYTFRFNRRKSKSRGKLFFRLAQQAVAVGPTPYDEIVQQTHRIPQKTKPQAVGPT